MEVGFAGLDLPSFGDPGPFLRGYGHTTFTPAERTRRRLYSLHLVLVLIVETAYRRYSDPNHEEWTRSLLADLLPTFGLVA